MRGLRSDAGLEDILPSVSFGLLIGLYVAFNYLSAADTVLDAVKWFQRPHIQSVPGGMDKISGECSLC